jgi:hypothetical protein
MPPRGTAPDDPPRRIRLARQGALAQAATKRNGAGLQLVKRGGRLQGHYADLSVKPKKEKAARTRSPPLAESGTNALEENDKPAQANRTDEEIVEDDECA